LGNFNALEEFNIVFILKQIFRCSNFGHFGA
jgi:hypothetical protein